MTRWRWIAILSTLAPLIALGVETLETQINPTTPHAAQAQSGELTAIDMRFSREQWGLNETEWQRYRSLMQGIRGSVSPGTLSPIEVLGIHAQNEAERRDYARRWARLMKEDAERILAFQHAYDEAWRALNPTGQRFDPARIDALSSVQREAVLQAGDRLLLFTRLEQCTSCRTYVEVAQKAASRADVQLDLYFVDAKGDDALRAWIARQGFDPDRVRSRRITFNHHRGELTRVAGVGASVPKLVRLRGTKLMPLEPYQLGY